MNRRRSTRLAIAPAPATKSPKPVARKRKAEPAEAAASDAPATPPVAKKPRVTRGKLKNIVEMPADILYEIFSYLSPTDLLHLARTIKGLRAILMSQSSKTVWQAARAGVSPSMPECPAHMSEPAYADLAFGKHCHYCLRKIATLHRQWYARVVICRRCINEHCVKQLDTTPFSLEQFPILIYLHELFPKFECEAYVPTVELNNPSPKRGDAPKEMFVFVDYWILWEKVGKELQTEQEREQWAQKTTTEMSTARHHSGLCETWYDEYLEVLDAERILVEKSRRKQVAERVNALGWAEDVKKMSSWQRRFEDDEYIDQVCRKELTKSVWKMIDRQINEYMRPISEERLARERKVLLKQRLPILREIWLDQIKDISLATRGALPSTTELLTEPAIHDIIFCQPHDKVLTKVHIAPAVGAIFPELKERVQRRADTELLDLLRKAYGDDPAIDPNTVFALATTIFRCRSCPRSRVFWYEDIIPHSCVRACNFPKPLEDEEYIGGYLGKKERYRSHTRTTEVHTSIYNSAKYIVKLCGLDPLTATKKAMDELNPIFECLRCHSHTNGRATMSWWTAISHLEAHFNGGNSPDETHKRSEFVLLTGEEASIARARIAEEYSRSLRKDPCLVACARCGEGAKEICLVKYHAEYSHGVKKFVNADVIPDPDKDQMPSVFYMWPPRDE